MVRFVYGQITSYPAGEAVDLIRLADELGFDGCNLADDPFARDPWTLAAAAARETDRIQLGFSATHVYLREPTLIAQALATLDELSRGRASAVVSFGDPGILDAYHVEWRGGRPLARVREALGVMRTLLDGGELDHEGEFFRYSGLSIAARPVQDHLPLLLGAVGGPRSFRLGGEVADGVQCVGCSRENTEFVIAHATAGAEAAGRARDELDLGTATITAVAEDPAAAKEAARIMAGNWLATMPSNLVERHGLDPDEVERIGAATAAGDVEEALRCCTPEMGEAFAIAGTPEECAERIRDDLVEPGFDHVLLAIADPVLVEAYGGPHLEGLPSAREQLQLAADRILPAFADSG